AGAGDYMLGVRVYTATAPSGSMYPEFAWDAITVFPDYSKAMQKIINRFRTYLMMWTSRYESVFASTNNLADFEIYTALYEGLMFFNLYPPYQTDFTLDDLPVDIEGTLFLCASLYALIGMEFFEIGQHFQYNDHGLSLIRDKSGRYAALLGQITAMVSQQLPLMKKMIGMSSIRVRGMFSGTSSMPRNLERALRGTRYYRR
ncbi:unnamed protein product, partial [marine sediment metagenome]